MFAKYLRPPREQKFWQVVAYVLKPLGIGRQEWWGRPKQPKVFTIMYYITITFGPISFFSQVAFLYLNYSNYPFFEAANIFCTVVVGFVINVKLFCARRPIYENVLKEFVNVMHLSNYEPMTPFVKKTIIKMERYSRWTAIGLFLMTEIDLDCGLLFPVLNNYLSGAFSSNGTVRFQTFVYALMPFDYEYDMKNWILMHIANVYLTEFGCGLFVVSDIILYWIIFHLIGRIEILKHNLEELSFSFKDYTEEEVQDRLGRCVQDHVLILRFFSDLQDAFGMSVTGTYAVNLIFDSVLILEFQYGDRTSKMTDGLMVILYMGSLLLMSFLMELIGRKSNELSDAVYGVPWEQMTIPHRRIVLLLLLHVQPVLVFTGFGGLRAGYQPAISIIKSTFSYNVMLKTKSGRIEA